MEWSQAVANLLPGEVVAIDGKTVRRSHDKRAGRKAIHLVSAWASANTLTLGQVMTGEKSNEITAIPRLLEMLELFVTIDAKVRRRLLKGSRLTTCWRSRRTRGGCSGTCSRGLRRQACHHSQQGACRRECWVIRDPVCLGYLSGERVARVKGGGITAHARYYISSLVSRPGTLSASRAHH